MKKIYEELILNIVLIVEDTVRCSKSIGDDIGDDIFD